jgi:cytochrome c oxidase subunit 2
MIDTRREYDHLAAIYWPIAVAVFVVVLVLVVFAALHFRSDEEGLPPQRAEAPKTEGAYVLVLVGVFAVLVYLTFSSMSRYDANAVTKQGAEAPNLPRPGAGKPLTVRVTAARWNWRFDYPAQGVTEAGIADRRATLVVPADTNVIFEQTSLDVVHSFFVPHLRFKRDAYPERVDRFALGFGPPAEHPGGGACAEYCGLRHSYMGFDVRVLAPADFERWAAGRRRAAGGTR